MNLFLIAFVAYTVLFGLLWHNKSSRDDSAKARADHAGESASRVPAGDVRQS